MPDDSKNAEEQPSPFAQRSDGLDPDIDQGLIRGTERHFAQRLEKARKRDNPVSAGETASGQDEPMR
jgi:hypothetical protein